MSTTFIVHKNHGHPWTKEPGWDGMELKADSEAELDEALKKYDAEFWAVWIRDNTGRMSAFLYRPQNCKGMWKRNPGGEIVYL